MNTNSVRVVGFIDLSKFDKPKRSVSLGAKQFLKDCKRKEHIRSKINSIWGGFINKQVD
jgi:hypothetical protein